MSEAPPRGAGLLRLVAGAAGLAALAAAFLAPAFRDVEGYLAASFVVPLGFGSGLILLAALSGRAHLALPAWTALLLIGQAAALQLVGAGRFIGYQHYSPVGELLTGTHAVWTTIVALHGVAVATGLILARPRIRSLLGARPAIGKVAAVLGVIFVTGAAASRDPSLYAGDLVVSFSVQLVGLGNALLIALAVPASAIDAVGGWIERFLSDDDSSSSFWRVDRFMVGAAIWAFAVTAFLSFAVYQWHPHVPDEVVYLINAKYLAAGRLALPLPPVPDAFSIDLMTYEPTRWYSPVPPGWPLVLAAGAWLGVPWLVNPLLSGISVIAAHIFVRSLFGRRLARITTLLLCVSPWFLFLGMSLMTHQLTLAAALIAAVAAERLRLGGRTALAIIAGGGIGLLALIRPLEGLVVAVLLGFHVLLSGPFRRRIVPVAVMAAASIAVASVTLPWNRYYTGDATYFPIMAYTDALYGPGSNALGFGPDRGLPFGGLDPFPGHGLRDAAVNAMLNSFQVNVELLGWMTGSLALIAVLLVSGGIRRNDLRMLAVLAAVVGAHTFYWFSGGPDFGARYWYLILVPCLVLVARGLDVLAGAFRSRSDGVRPLVAAAALCLSAMIVFVPWRGVDKYFHYRNMRPDVRALVRTHDIDDDLVLIRGFRMPDYMSAVPYGSLMAGEGGPVIAWDRDDALRLDVLRAYPDRDVFIIEGPSLTGGGFRMIEGPVPARQLIGEMTGER